MVDYKKATFDDVVADAQANKRVDYLKKLGAKTFTDKNGKKARYTWLQIKHDYYATYYKEMMPVASKEKTKTIYERLAEL